MDKLFAMENRKWVSVGMTPSASSSSSSSSTSSEKEAKKEEPQPAGEQGKANVSILDQDLKDSGLHFSPLHFSPTEKSLLRDNMTSVLRKDIQPKFLRLSHEKMKVGTYLSASVRLVHKDHAYKIKRISFDRPVLHNGLLFFIDGMERNGKESFHIWFYLRLVLVQDGVAQIQIPEPMMTLNKKTKKEESRPLWQVHDWNCKKCKHRKPCDHKFKSVEQITEYTFGVHIKFPVKLEGALYLYAITLNSPRQAALSSRVFLSSASAKSLEKAEKARAEKEAKMAKKAKADKSSTGRDDNTDSSDPSFSEAVTDTSAGNDIASDLLLDDESFFEKSYEASNFMKSKSGAKGKEEDDLSDDDEETGGGGGGGALTILDVLRNTNKK